MNQERQLLCRHEKIDAEVTVNRLEDAGTFMADIRICCKDCGLPFSFKGLPQGLDMHGAATSPDGTEARCAITPGENLDLRSKQAWIL